MRNGILAAFAAICLITSVASALPGSNNRSTAATGDSGTNLRTFKSIDLCDGEWDAWVSGIQSNCNDGSSCTIDSLRGYNVSWNQTCCRNIYKCMANGQPLPEEEVLAIQAAADDLDDVFAPLQSYTYWGYAAGTVRSPNAGRGASAKAKLDACLFYSDVDAIDALGGTDADKYGYCTQTTYGCASTMKNEHCRDNSAAVCVDRCACNYPNNGVDTCNNL